MSTAHEFVGASQLLKQLSQNHQTMKSSTQPGLRSTLMGCYLMRSHQMRSCSRTSYRSMMTNCSRRQVMNSWKHHGCHFGRNQSP